MNRAILILLALLTSGCTIFPYSSSSHPRDMRPRWIKAELKKEAKAAELTEGTFLYVTTEQGIAVFQLRKGKWVHTGWLYRNGR